MSSSDESLKRNFEISYRLYEKIGMNALDPNYRLNWRTFYPGTINVFALIQIAYLLWTVRTDLLEFLVILPHFLFSVQGFHKFIICTRRSAKVVAVCFKLTEIQRMMMETKSNGPIICRILNISRLIQKLIFVFYLATALLITFVPISLWLLLGKTSYMFVFFVPGVEENSSEEFVLKTTLHAAVIGAAFIGYTAHECLFLSLIMPVGAYVDAFGNEVKQLNTMLNLNDRNDPAIRKQLNRVAKLHQLLNEYETMLEDLFNILTLSTIGLNYLGIISSIVLVLKSNDRMAYVFLTLMFELLTRYCLMGTIITAKNEQLLLHLHDINWYLLPPDQEKEVGLILHKAQNPTSVTMGKFAPLNLAGYMSVLKSIYTYVMFLVTVLD